MHHVTTQPEPSMQPSRASRAPSTRAMSRATDGFSATTRRIRNLAREASTPMHGPGVRTRRFAGRNATDADNNTKLLRELAGVPLERRAARYVCVLALALPDPAAPGGLRLITRRGTTNGRITSEPRGSGGFGYDPLFEPARERAGGRTFGQYSQSEKDAISHRGRAARRMAVVLGQLGF